MKRRRKTPAPGEDFRVQYLIDGQRPAKITSWAGFRFYHDEPMQRALWDAIGLELMKQYPRRKLWAQRRFGAPAAKSSE